jgi:ubiquinone/menaquinone biosynthesis C-methylase UbiE
MDAADKDRIIQRYNARLAQYGYDIRTLASGTEERRRIRYRVLYEVGVTSGSSIMDLGCGFGDFYAYLREQGIEVQYTGYDINPALIEVAKKKYPQAAFSVKDILEENFPDFDFIVSSSAFNLTLRVHDNYSFIEHILKTCYSHARKGVAVDFMTSYVDFNSSEAFYYSPERVFAISKGITKCVCLRHDYPLYEFCIYLYPDFQGWSSK